MTDLKVFVSFLIGVRVGVGEDTPEGKNLLSEKAFFSLREAPLESMFQLGEQMKVYESVNVVSLLKVAPYSYSLPPMIRLFQTQKKSITKYQHVKCHTVMN